MRAQAWVRGAVARLMTPFNCPAAHASSPYHLLLLPSSSYSLLSRLRRHFASSSSSRSSSPAYNTTQNTTSTFMEVVQEVLKHGSTQGVRAAIRSDQKSYNLVQLIASALDVYNILRNKNVPPLSFSMTQNGSTGSSVKGINGTGFLGGARIGIVAKPSPEFVAGIFGTWLSGGVAVPLALSYPEAELLHVMNDSDISMILSTKEHQDIMENISTKCSAHCSLLPSVTSIPVNIDCQEPSSTEVTSSISSLIAEIDSSKEIRGDDPALILYTSGTTGKPKGVVHTHKGIVSQVEFMPKFSVRGIWQRWRESYPNNGSKNDEAITVPTMYTRLLQGYDGMDPEQQSASSFAAKQLRLMMCGSSALPSPLMKRWEEVTGHRLLERYGMTEFVMALSNPLHGARKEGTVGKPLPRVEAKIIMEDGTETTSEVGELCIRSPSLFKEYWRKPEVTAESFIDGGFFKTGDTVTVDDEGYFIILGRTNADIMKVGGYKLSALEIESVLLQHEIVLECAVLGLPDEAYGEIICAIIVPKEDSKKRAELDSKPALTLEALTSQQEGAEEIIRSLAVVPGRQTFRLSLTFVFPLHVLSLLAVRPAAPEEVDKVDSAKAGEKPVVVIVAAGVQVLRQPARPPSPPARLVDHLDDQAPHQAPRPQGHVEQRHAEAGHALGQLGVEELDHPDHAERLGEPRQRVLRHEPERRHGAAAGPAAPAQSLPAPCGLHHGGRGHRRGAEHQAPADPLLHGQPPRVACQPPQRRRGPPVVAARPERHGEHVEHGERAAGHAEPAGADAPVHRVGLRHREVLIHGLREEDGGRPDRHHADRRLELLHLVHRAQPPPVADAVRAATAGLVLLRVADHARLVQEPEQIDHTT
uniref:4-coumarate--CoA ligase n=1 Tax=Oryza meridionalis TaxID=40149 RepID=A0A0E0C812_9ORYZ